VTDPEPTSLVDAYALTKIMRRINPEGRLDLLVNSVASETEAMQVHRRLRSATERFLSFAIELFGWIESDPFLPKAVRRQKLVVLEYPDSSSARAFHRLAGSVMRSLNLERRSTAELVAFPAQGA
jgi:flagellar biosynthesis protein FlhG